ncbi:MAG: hypothetical protein JSV18_07570 [Candidatus Bathyarchaeota archaeon]|nr:MAG: hypothetical protein JSV18_07570 [Candidatus Bathyarchaeota archaeon]
MNLEIEGKSYVLEPDTQDKYVVPGASVAYCSEMAEDFKPVVIDPQGHGTEPFPPEFMAYRIVVDSEKRGVCLLYEVYWKRQDCTWRDLNKDHDHDYEQIQIHFDAQASRMQRVIVSSVGPVDCAGHGVEVYSGVTAPEARRVNYSTSPKGPYPWGGSHGQKWFTQVREMPLEMLVFSEMRPIVRLVSCYHVFAGMKRGRPVAMETELDIDLRRLDRGLLERWYYRHAKNRFGRDLSKPFEEPYVMYYPPPEDWASRVAYALLWLFASPK